MDLFAMMIFAFANFDLPLVLSVKSQIRSHFIIDSMNLLVGVPCDLTCVIRNWNWSGIILYPQQKLFRKIDYCRLNVLLFKNLIILGFSLGDLELVDLHRAVLIKLSCWVSVWKKGATKFRALRSLKTTLKKFPLALCKLTFRSFESKAVVWVKSRLSPL